MDGVYGLGELEALADRFREAGSNSGLPDDIQDELADVAQDLDGPLGDSIRGRLPRSGGLADLVADSLEVAVDRTGAAGVEIRVSADVDLEGIDSGVVHHPVYGRSPNVTQRIPSGSVSDPLRESETDFERGAERGAERTARYIEKGMF